MGLTKFLDQKSTGLLTRFERLAPTGIKTVVGLTPVFDVGRPLSSPFDYKKFGWEGYRKNVVIFACSSHRFEAVSAVPLIMKRKRGKSGSEENVTDHPLMEVLLAPNKEETGEELTQQSQMMEDLSGDSYLLKSRFANSGRLPGRLDHLPTWATRPIPNDDGDIEKYKYTLDDGYSVEIPATEIIHFKGRPDPNNRFVGMSLIAVLARQGELDNRIADYLLALMTNSGIPAGILKSKLQVETDERTRIQKGWKDLYSGMKSGTIAVLDGDWDFKAEGLTPKVLEFERIIGYVESRICATFDIPPIVIGVQIGLANATYSNFDTAKNIADYLAIRLAAKRAAKLTAGLAAEYDPNLVIEVDHETVKQMKQDPIAVSQEAREDYKTGLITLNEAREMKGRKRVEGGDVFYSANSAAPPDPLMIGTETQSRRILAAPKEESADRKQWKTLLKIADLFEPKLRRAFIVAISETQSNIVQSEVEAALAANDVTAAIESIPWDSLSEDLVNSFESVIFKIVSKSADAAAGFAPPELGISFDLTNPKAIQWAKQYSADLVTRMTDESRAAINSIIVEGFGNGTQVKVMSRQIQEWIGLTERDAKALVKYEEELRSQGLSEEQILKKTAAYYDKKIKLRAQNISRTETIRASNMGQQILWEDAAKEGLIDSAKIKRIWIATDDDLTDDECLDLDGTQVGLYENFPGDIFTPPAHPSCRCAIGLKFE